MANSYLCFTTAGRVGPRAKQLPGGTPGLGAYPMLNASLPRGGFPGISILGFWSRSAISLIFIFRPILFQSGESVTWTCSWFVISLYQRTTANRQDAPGSCESKDATPGPGQGTQPGCGEETLALCLPPKQGRNHHQPWFSPASGEELLQPTETTRHKYRLWQSRRPPAPSSTQQTMDGTRQSRHFSMPLTQSVNSLGLAVHISDFEADVTSQKPTPHAALLASWTSPLTCWRQASPWSPSSPCYIICFRFATSYIVSRLGNKYHPEI